MAYIDVPENVPGIRSLALYRPETAGPLYELAQTLLRGPSSLSPAERELIAAAVSSQNNCRFCTSSHAAVARSLLAADAGMVDAALLDPETPEVGDRLRALLTIARKTADSGTAVGSDDIERARSAGADDTAIHDTVLIAATFSLFNRYVDGLATLTPTDESVYVPMGERLAMHGYAPPKTLNP